MIDRIDAQRPASRARDRALNWIADAIIRLCRQVAYFNETETPHDRWIRQLVMKKHLTWMRRHQEVIFSCEGQGVLQVWMTVFYATAPNPLPLRDARGAISVDWIARDRVSCPVGIRIEPYLEDQELLLLTHGNVAGLVSY